MRSSAETYAVDGIGFSVNVFKHEYGEFDSQFSILDGDYIVSGEMPVTKFDGFGGTFNGGKSYKTYAALAKDVSSDYHFSHADLNGAYAFLAEADKAFGGVLSIGRETEPWDSAFYFWKERMVSFYTLRLDNSNGFFIDCYKDHLNPYFLFALEQIRTRRDRLRGIFRFLRHASGDGGYLRIANGGLLRSFLSGGLFGRNGASATP